MIPILFDSTETQFTSHGIGDLIDCDECTATQNNEGEYELSFTYPIDAELFHELTINRYILAKPNTYDRPQIFQIYGYEKGIDGKMQINCQHISYNLAGIPTKPISKVNNVQAVMTQMKSNAAVNCPFTFETDVTDKPLTDDETFSTDEPKSIRAILLDGDDSIRGSWNGDLVFDNYTVKFLKHGGEERGIVLEYGVDITDLSIEENISEMITGVYPYYKDGNSDNPTYVYGDVQYAEGTFTKHTIAALDVSEYFTSTPTKAQVEEKARAWMKAEKVGQPEITSTISYADLKQDVRMHDAIIIRFSRMGIDVTAKVSSYTFDVLNERCTEIEVSNAKHSSQWAGFEDASRLKRGFISPDRIKNGSVGGGKLGGGSIKGWHIVGGAVTSDKFEQTVKENYDKGAIINGAIEVNGNEVRVVNKKLLVASLHSDGDVVCGTVNGVTITKTGITVPGYNECNWSQILPQ